MFILTILIHELGHFMFGLATGYRLLHIEILGYSLEHIGSVYRVKKYKNAAVGQCMMYSDNENRNPIFLVCGGIIFNLIFGISALTLAITMNGLIIKMIILVFGSINLSIAVTNMFLGSATSDGKVFWELTLGEAKKERRILYNRILRIAVYLREGRSYRDMPRDIFKDNLIREDTAKSTEKEMQMHVYRYLVEKGEKDWDSARIGEPVASIIEKALKTDGKSDKDRDRVFNSILQMSEKEMFTGEFLCAARCYCIICKNRCNGG